MKTVVGLFDSMPHAEKAMRDLEAIGIARNDISVAANNSDGRYATGNVGTTTDAPNTVAETTKGAIEGAGVGLVAGLAALAIPGLGWLAIGGWLTTTLVGAAVGAAVGLTGALMGVGVPHEEAEYYNEGVRRGGTLLAVKAPDNQAQQVAEILGDDGAVDIDERADLYRQEGFIPTQAPVQTNTTPVAAAAAPARTVQANVNTQPVTTNLDREGETKLNVTEENLVVGKREVERGGVRVYQHVTETPVQEQVTLHEEHISVERNPVNRPVTAADAAFKEGSFELHEKAEEAVVGKEARVVEEVVIGKQATDRVETVSDTVRRTDVEVEQLPGTGYATAGAVNTVGGTVASGVANAEHAARDAKDNLSGAAYRTEANIENAVGANGLPGVQTGGRAVDGSPDTRGITEKIADAVTGDRIDDKTGKPVA